MVEVVVDITQIVDKQQNKFARKQKYKSVPLLDVDLYPSTQLPAFSPVKRKQVCAQGNWYFRNSDVKLTSPLPLLPPKERISSGTLT